MMFPKRKVEVCVASGSQTIGQVLVLHVLQSGLVGPCDKA